MCHNYCNSCIDSDTCTSCFASDNRILSSGSCVCGPGFTDRGIQNCDPCYGGCSDCDVEMLDDFENHDALFSEHSHWFELVSMSVPGYWFMYYYDHWHKDHMNAKGSYAMRSDPLDYYWDAAGI